jgi:DNA replication protein DnaC
MTKPLDLLSPSQQYAFELFTQGKNIFISGQAGTGKSFIIDMMYKHAQKQNKRIHVTALTGCAALLLNMKAKPMTAIINYYHLNLMEK